MWDENKFISDYKQTSDKIKPSDEFVNKLMSLGNEEKTVKIIKKRKVQKIYKMVSVAAMIILICGLGIYLASLNSDNGGNGNKQPIDISVGMNGSNQNTTTSNSDVFEDADDKTLLEVIIEELEDEFVVVFDVYGNELSDKEKEELKDILNSLEKKADMSGVVGQCDEYVINGDDEINVKIYFDTYVMIGNEIYEIE